MLLLREASVKTEAPTISTETYSEHPTLTATWYNDKGSFLRLAAEHSTCRIDPRTPHISYRSPDPHPECKAMLDGLRDEVEELLEVEA